MGHGWGGARPGSGRKSALDKKPFGSKRQKGLCIYIVAEVGSDDACKIGITGGLNSRLAGLQTGNWRKLYVFAAYEVQYPDLLCDLEQQAKIFFSGKCLLGEWFKVPPSEMKEAIEIALESLGLKATNLMLEIGRKSGNVIRFVRQDEKLSRNNGPSA